MVSGLVLGNKPTALPCIVRELTWGGFVAVAVGVGDRCQVSIIIIVLLTDVV